MLSPDAQKAIEALKGDCEGHKDDAKESMQQAEAEDAMDSAKEAEETLELAKEICEEENIDENDVPEIEEMQKMVDEAYEYAETAQELEDFIEEAFEEALENGLTEEDFEEFKKGVLTNIYGTEDEKAIEKTIQIINQTVDKNAVRAVNYNSGKIKYFSKDEPLGYDWAIVQPVFTGIWDGGNEIVVDNTIEGMKEVAEKLGIKEVGKKSDTSAIFETNNQQFLDVINQTGMFMVQTDWNSGGKQIVISY